MTFSLTIGNNLHLHLDTLSSHSLCVNDLKRRVRNLVVVCDLFFLSMICSV